jgi:dynamin 1-like protein|tara:strand:- start:595 stop:1581 length:987 start_codon:yes stop_codon:yes gene_type:complete
VNNNAAQRELASLGDGRPDDPAQQAAMVLEKLHGYAARFTKAVAGKNEDLNTTALEGGARIHYVLQDIFVKGLESLDPTRAMSEEDIRTAIQNSAGTKAVLLLPEEPFEMLVKQAIRKMTEPCQKCARLVHDELTRIARQLIHSLDLQRYPRLAQSVEDATKDFLNEGLVPAESMIASLVECQLAHINTSHPEFVGGSKALRLAQVEVATRRGGAVLDGETNENDVKSPGGTSRKVLGEKTNSVLSDSDVEKKKPTASSLYSHDDGVVTLREPPGKLQASQPKTDEEMLQVFVTRCVLGVSQHCFISQLVTVCPYIAQYKTDTFFYLS